VVGYHNYVSGFLERQPPEVKADAGIVFFGDYMEENTRLGPDSKLRAMEAVDMFSAGQIRSIICVGGYDLRYWKGRPHLMKNFLISKGIPENCIFYDSLSFNTITNWQEARKIIEKHHLKKVVAISAPLHTFRIYRMIGSDSIYYRAYRYKPEKFRDFWRIFKDTHREWLSHFLSFALKDKVRNRIIHFYRTVRFRFETVL
jgi:vancomycin permeability regulator SanA